MKLTRFQAAIAQSVLATSLLVSLAACAPTPTREGTGEYLDDSVITGKVKASIVDDRELYIGAFKVVTERGIVYLMGRVTQREAERVTQIARTINGVQRVVRLFEIISEEELRRITPQLGSSPAKPAAAPAQPPATSTVTPTPLPPAR